MRFPVAMFFFVVLSLFSLLSLGSTYSTLSDETLKHLPSPGEDFNIKTGALLAPILRTRVSGTEGNAAVLQHFVDFFTKNLPEWTLEFHNSSSTTPTSNGQEIPFRNLIATRDPPGSSSGEVGRLALVAHYDSKLTPKGFIGATDSAAPCAMLLHMARSIDAALTNMWAARAGDGLDALDEAKGVQILLLDGEEAFQSWTDTDSLYGSRYDACIMREQNSRINLYQSARRRLGIRLPHSRVHLPHPSRFDRALRAARPARRLCPQGAFIFQNDALGVQAHG